MVKKENEMRLKWAKMRMIRCMFDTKVTDRFTCNDLRRDIDDIIN